MLVKNNRDLMWKRGGVSGWMSFDRFHVYAYVGLLAELLL